MAQRETETESEPDVDLAAVRQWSSLLGLYFRSMELGLRELLTVAEQAVDGTATREDYERARTRCHALRGASALAGFRGVSSLLQELELGLDRRLAGDDELTGRSFHQKVVRVWQTYEQTKKWVQQVQQGEAA